MPVLDLGHPGGGLTDEEFLEELLGARDRRNSCSTSGPTHLASSMDAAFRSDRERGEAGATPDGLGRELVETDVAIGSPLGIHFEHPAEKRMNRKVTSLDPVIETTIDGYLVADRIERLEESGRLVGCPRSFRKEAVELEAEQVADGHHPPRAGRFRYGCPKRVAGSQCIRQKGGHHGERQGRAD